MNQFQGFFKYFPFSECRILILWKKHIQKQKFREVDLFHFTSFFGLDYLKFTGVFLPMPGQGVFMHKAPATLFPSSS